MGRTSVGEYLARAREAGVRYADVAGMGEAEVEALLFKRPEPAVLRPMPDWAEVAAQAAQARGDVATGMAGMRNGTRTATVIASFAGTTGLIGSSMPSRACGARFCLRNCARSTTPG